MKFDVIEEKFAKFIRPIKANAISEKFPKYDFLSTLGFFFAIWETLQL